MIEFCAILIAACVVVGFVGGVLRAVDDRQKTRRTARAPLPPSPPPRKAPPPDRLASTVATWLADDRPAWETVEAFERDVERVLSGGQTRSPGMPLREPRRAVAVARPWEIPGAIVVDVEAEWERHMGEPFPF